MAEPIINNACEECDKLLRQYQTEIKYQELKYEELNRNWHNLRNQRNKLTKYLKDIYTHCRMQNLKYNTTACEVLEILDKADKEIGLWEK